MTRGVTLVEMMTVVVIITVAAAIALQPVAHTLDRMAVAEGADRYAALHETTRQLAVARAGLARLELDTAMRAAALSWRGVSGTWDTVEVRPLGSARVRTAQPVVTFNPLGFGYGVSNSTIIFARGSAAETLTVSRTGRLKR